MPTTDSPTDSLTAAKHWLIYPAAPEKFIAESNEHALLAQVLHNRGLRTAGEVAAFLARADAVRENPYRLRDMVPAVQRLVKAIEQGEIICVYGDFDADGVTSTALLVTALQAAGGKVGPYIPDRVDEGYGLNVDSIARIASKGARLLVTVDCGIRSVAEVQHAMDLGLDVIVTDHHTVGPTLPPALAVINPRRVDCTSGYERLAGVGVAYRLAQAVLRAVAQQGWARLSPAQASDVEQDLLDLVALGTVADMMPLLGENRSLVQRGLDQLNLARRPGVKALMEQADLRKGLVDTTAISFRLAPRINAAGRLSQAPLAYQLLRTNDEVNADGLAREIEGINRARRELTTRAQNEAETQLAAQVADDAPLYMVASEEFEPGIVGLVAGKISERFYRPAIVIERGESESRGSARSIAEFHITEALDAVSELLLRHGGHARAAGFTLKTARLPDFESALREVAAEKLADYSDLRPSLKIDAEVPFDEVKPLLHEQLARLEPMGQENPSPLLLCRSVRVRDVRKIGGGKHLRLVLDAGPHSAVVDAVAFGQGEQAKQLSAEMKIDVVFQLEVNEWQGRRRLQMNVQDMRAASGEPLGEVKQLSL